jgi:outer membrane protein TolC
MSWPLFNGFTRETGITRSVTSRDAAIAQAEDARRSVNADLTQYLAALAAARSSIEIAIASRAAAAEDLRVQQERYRLGAATIVEVLTSQVSLDQAEVDIIRARFDYLVARAQLEALIGREL